MGHDRLPHTAWADTVIYEAQVKGATIQHPGIEKRGSYLGLTEPAFVDHLRRLGVTAIELMPVFAHAAEPKLIARGLSNYWGYNPIAFFVPDPRFVSTGSPLDSPREFKTMVKALHAAGLEVILDVVFNHTAEGDHLGPHLSFAASTTRHTASSLAAGRVRRFHWVRQHGGPALGAGIYQ